MQQNAKVRKSIPNSTKMCTRRFFHTANTMVTLIFVFGITFSLIQGGHTIHATECQSEKINTKFDENVHSEVFPYGEHDGDVNFCFWHNVLPDSGWAYYTCNRMPK